MAAGSEAGRRKTAGLSHVRDGAPHRGRANDAAARGAQAAEGVRPDHAAMPRYPAVHALARPP
jgi:hypothetical protein